MSKSGLKKFCSTLLTLCLLITIFSGCGQQAGGTGDAAKVTTGGSAEKETTEVKEEKPIDVTYFQYYWNGKPARKDGEIQKELAKRTGVNFKMDMELVSTPADVNKKMTIISASNGEWQDIAQFDFSSTALDIIKMMGDAGMLWDIKPYLKDYPNFAKVVGNAAARYEMDGKLYCYPTYLGDVPDFRDFSFAMVRKDLFTQLDIPFPKTPDEFIAMLKLAKEKFKTPDGKPIIPLVGCETYTLKDFAKLFVPITNESKYFYADDITTPNKNVTMPLFLDKELLLKVSRFANTLKKEGLLDSEFFTNKQAQALEKISSGSAFAASIFDLRNIFTTNDALMKSNKDSYMVMTPITFDPEMKRKAWAMSYPYGYATNVINKKTVSEEKLKRILKAIDYLSTPEGYALAWYGREGIESTKDADGRYDYTPEYRAKTNNANIADMEADGLIWYVGLMCASSLQTAIDKTPTYLQRSDGKESVTNLYGSLDKDAAGKLSPLDNPFYTVPLDGEKLISIKAALEELLGPFTIKVVNAKNDEEIIRIVEQHIEDSKKAGAEDALKERIEQITKRFNLN